MVRYRSPAKTRVRSFSAIVVCSGRGTSRLLLLVAPRSCGAILAEARAGRGVPRGGGSRRAPSMAQVARDAHPPPTGGVSRRDSLPVLPWEPSRSHATREPTLAQ